VPYDRHEIWRNVASNYAELKKKPPEGRVPVVEVYIANRELPVVTAVVETSRDSEFPWIKLYTGDKASAHVWTYEGHVQRIEIAYRPKGKFKAGFHVGPTSDPE
jgi:hypothetical protein